MSSHSMWRTLWRTRWRTPWRALLRRMLHAAIAVPLVIPGAVLAQRGGAGSTAAPARLSPTAEVRRSYQALAESLRVAREADAEERRRQRATPRDTIRAGALLVASDSQWGAAARVGTHAARERLEFLFGAPRLEASLRDLAIVVATRDVRRTGLVRRDPEINAFRGVVPARTADYLNGDAHVLAGQIEQWIVVSMTAELSDHADKSLLRWRALPTPDSSLIAQVLASAYVDLTFAASIPARRCMAGDTSGCAIALGLVAPPMVLDSLFTRDDRRALGRIRFFVLHAGDKAGIRAGDGGPQPLSRVGSGAALTTPNPCEPVPATDACEAFVRGLPRHQWPAPMGNFPRDVLLFTAFDLGGAGAAGRLLADSTAPIVSRLESAARAPRDSLLREWRRRMLAARPAPMPVGGRDAILAFAAIVLFVGAGLARWSRT